MAETIPIIGFYLQPAVGGRVFTYRFWREFADIENLAAIKIAPFDRYLTIDVVRAVVDSGREPIAGAVVNECPESPPASSSPSP